MDLQVCTIGYQGKTVADFLRSLHKAGIELVIDVRELPLSRRRGFSKTPLSLALREANIGYTHLRQAGNPYRADRADLTRCLALYRAHLETHPEVLDSVLNAAAGKRAALLCFEACASECHRSIIASGIQRRIPGAHVRDL